MTTQPKTLTLPNGLTIVVDERPDAGRVTCAIGIRSGSDHEPAELCGISHLIEHMVFKGSAKYTRQEIAAIEDLGGDTGASTCGDCTLYSSNCFPEDFPHVFDILSDMVLHPTFPENEFSKERKVILGEIGESEDDPDDTATVLTLRHIFQDSPAGRPTLGFRKTLRKMTPDILRAYHASHYTASNMVVSVCGNITVENVRNLVQNKMQNLPAGQENTCPPPSYTPVDVRINAKLSQTQIRLAFPGIRKTDPDYPAAITLQNILSGGISSRLHECVRERNGLAYSIACSHELIAGEGVFMVFTSTGIGQAGAMTETLCKALVEATRTVSQGEIRKTVASIRMGLVMEMEGMGGLDTCHAEDVLAKRHLGTSMDTLEKYKTVTPEDVMRVAKRIFSAKPSLVAYGPLKGLPGMPEIEEMLRGKAPKPQAARKKRPPAPAPKPPGTP